MLYLPCIYMLELVVGSSTLVATEKSEFDKNELDL